MKQSLKMTLKGVYVIFISLACSNMGLVPPRFGIKYAIYKTKNIKKYKCTIQLTIHFEKRCYVHCFIIHQCIFMIWMIIANLFWTKSSREFSFQSNNFYRFILKIKKKVIWHLWGNFIISLIKTTPSQYRIRRKG